MYKDIFYIDDLASIRAFCTNSDKEDVYKYIYSLQQENQSLKKENKQLKERIERIDNYLDKNYTAENQYWFDHIRDIIEDR